MHILFNSRVINLVWLLLIVSPNYSCVQHSANSKSVNNEQKQDLQNQRRESLSEQDSGWHGPSYQALLKAVNRTKKILGVQKEHFFSDSIRKDTFHLVIRGPNLLNSVAIFSIISFKGDEIYHEEFLGSELLGDDDNSNPKHQNSVILKKVKTFFDEENFSTPLDTSLHIDTTTNEDENLNYQVYKDLTGQKYTVSFAYSYGYEGTYWIAYDAKKNHVELLYSMD